MKTYVQTFLCILLAISFSANGLTTKNSVQQTQADTSASDNAASGLVKLLRISAKVDGSGRIIFSRHGVRYEHKHWAPPEDMIFDGQPWTDLSRTPSTWRNEARQLDLTKAWIVERKGRDVIALEHTPEGFDLYLCDSPNGADDYLVTIAIPRCAEDRIDQTDPETDR